MKRIFLIWLLMILVGWLISGCATVPQALVPISQSCPAATDIPNAPTQTLQLDASKPGEAAKDYATNRAAWIGYGTALRKQLEACQ